MQASNIASAIGMQTIAVDGNTEAAAIANAKTARESQLATGKIVMIEINYPNYRENLTTSVYLCKP